MASTPEINQGQPEVIQKPDTSQETQEQVGTTQEQASVSEKPQSGAPSSSQSQQSDDQAQQQTTDDTREVFYIPQEEKVLEEEAKGSDTNPLTWFARFWIRMVKKAILLGKRIIVGNPQK